MHTVQSKPEGNQSCLRWEANCIWKKQITKFSLLAKGNSEWLSPLKTYYIKGIKSKFAIIWRSYYRKIFKSIWMLLKGIYSETHTIPRNSHNCYYPVCRNNTTLSDKRKKIIHALIKKIILPEMWWPGSKLFCITIPITVLNYVLFTTFIIHLKDKRACLLISHHYEWELSVRKLAPVFLIFPYALPLFFFFCLSHFPFFCTFLSFPAFHTFLLPRASLTEWSHASLIMRHWAINGHPDILQHIWYLSAGNPADRSVLCVIIQQILGT